MSQHTCTDRCSGRSEWAFGRSASSCPLTVSVQEAPRGFCLLAQALCLLSPVLTGCNQYSCPSPRLWTALKGLRGHLSPGLALPGQQPAHGQPLPSAGPPPVPHRSPWFCHTPPASCSTWAPRVATCLWCRYRPSARWRTRPSARTPCCSGEPADPVAGRDLSPRVGHGLLPLVPVAYSVSPGQSVGMRGETRLPTFPPR